MTPQERARRDQALARIHETVIPEAWKGLPARLAGTRIGDVAGAGLGILDDGWPSPCAVLRQAGIEQNIRVMSGYCAERGVRLAPHAKTTMAPQLLWAQVEAGAWALTVANVNQLRILQAFGFRRFVVANEIVDPSEASWLADRLRSRDGLEVFVFADSAAAVELLASAGASPARPLRVLIEMGIPGARCGLREVSEVVGLGREIERRCGLELVGVAGFEGVVGMLRDESTRARAREFGGLLAAAFTALRAAGLAQADDAFGTAGGSLYFDDVFAGWREGLGEVGDHAPFVMRSGCYVTQDHGNYDHQSPLGELNELSAGEHLTPAIEVVTRVVSTPEPEFCVVNAGKRDLSYDVALPTMLWHTSPATPLAAGSAACVGLNDQHGMFRGSGVAALAVGDKVGLGISHPCTTFDKWRAMAMVDEQLRVRDLIVTFI